MRLADQIAGVVVDVAMPGTDAGVSFIFDDDTWYDFYSSQEISDTAYIQLAGSDAMYRYVRDAAVCYNA